MGTSDARTLATDILAVVMQHQRLDNQAACAGRPRPCEWCVEAHVARTAHFVARGEPVEFVLPGFPAKSPNPRKVLGVGPDMAERLSLDFLARLCDRISMLYPPGGRIVICSDGRLFTHVVNFTDADVTLYQSEIQALIDDMDGTSLDLFHLGQHFPGHEYESMRAMLVSRYAEDIEKVEQNVRADDDSLRKYLGLTRFLLEDMLTPDYRGSRRALQKRARHAAYHLLQRSDAWSNLLAERFPHAVRLSIHPQPCGSAKLGIHLMDAAKDNWLTPWHGTAVEVDDERWVLMKREQAEALDVELVHIAGQPSHYRSKEPVSAIAARSESRLVC
jgi:pyoverdine/dityrosine biosynthesis protein Dit1